MTNLLGSKRIWIRKKETKSMNSSLSKPYCILEVTSLALGVPPRQSYLFQSKFKDWHWRWGLPVDTCLQIQTINFWPHRPISHIWQDPNYLTGLLWDGLDMARLPAPVILNSVKIQRLTSTLRVRFAGWHVPTDPNHPFLVTHKSFQHRIQIIWQGFYEVLFHGLDMARLPACGTV